MAIPQVTQYGVAGGDGGCRVSFQIDGMTVLISGPITEANRALAHELAASRTLIRARLKAGLPVIGGMLPDDEDCS